MHEEIYLYLI